MKILCLYNNDCALELFRWIKDMGHEIVLCSEKIAPKWCQEQDFDLAVSYTYRFILSSETIHALHNNVVNIHNSLLPFNRGADPNIWSLVEETPRGVTLHYIDEKLDKGFVISQEIIYDGDEETLSSSYNNLDRTAKLMFKKAFKYYEFWPSLKKQCLGVGTYHSLKDGVEIKTMIDSYDMDNKEFRTRVKILGVRKSSFSFVYAVALDKNEVLAA